MGIPFRGWSATTSPIYGGWFFITLVVFRLARRYPLIPFRRFHALIHLFAACLFAIVHGIYWVGLMDLVKPFDRMTAEPSRQLFAETIFYRFPLELLFYTLALGGAIALNFYERYTERAVAAARLESSLADARLHALEMQLQPHFLFNTLNAISALVRQGRNGEAVTMMAGLSELLRYTLDHAGDQQVALEDELAVLRRYLEIQHVRFPDRMSFEIDLAPEARRAAVPVLLLQPLAENAVRHGIATKAGSGVVEVRAFRSEGKLRIEVFNSGSLAVSSASGIGLRNTRARLQHLYGDEGRFELAGTDSGVTATVSIPWSEVA